MKIEEIDVTNAFKKPAIARTIVKFKCPNCGQAVIIRDNKERKLGLGWICPICGYKGP